MNNNLKITKELKQLKLRFLDKSNKIEINKNNKKYNNLIIDFEINNNKIEVVLLNEKNELFNLDWNIIKKEKDYKII